MPGFLELAYHTADIQYLFPLWHGGPAPPSLTPTLNKKQTGSLRPARRRLDELRLDRQSERPRQLSLAALHEQHDQAGMADRGHSGLSTLTDPQYTAVRKCDFWDALALPPS